MTGSGNWTYLLVDAGRAVLIDAGVGHPEHLQALAEALRTHGAMLERVLVTHAHSDHIGGASAIAALHPDARFYRCRGADPGRSGELEWCFLDDDQQLEFAGARLTTLLTPGHAPDHCVFWLEESRTVFSGDLVLPGGTVTIPFSRGGDVSAYLDSLERLIALAPSLLLPAHGRPQREPLAVLRRHIAHRLERERQVTERLAGGDSTVEAIAGSIYHGLAPALQPAARENVRAHLEKLKREGRVVESDGRWRLSTRLQESSPT